MLTRQRLRRLEAVIGSISDTTDTVVQENDGKLADDVYLHFGSGSGGLADLVNFDFKMGWSASNNRFQILPFRPTVGEQSRAHGLHIDLDDLFTGIGAAQQRGVTIEGGRAASGAVLDGDAHDILFVADLTNRAQSINGAYGRALSATIQNRDAGTLASMQGALISTRQRGDGGVVGEIRTLRIDLTHDVGGAESTGLVEGQRINVKVHAHGPAHGDTQGIAGLVVNNDATGSYNNKADAFKIRSLGQPFRYLFDFYDSRVNLAGTAIMRFPVNSGSLPTLWFIGAQTDDNGIRGEVGADNTIADGSWYMSVSAGAGALFVKVNDVWVSTT